MLIAEIAVPANPQEALRLAENTAQAGDRVLFIILLAIILGYGGWVIRRLFAKLDAKEQQMTAIAEKMLAVIENNNVVMEDIKELMEKIKAKSVVLVALALHFLFMG